MKRCSRKTGRPQPMTTLQFGWRRATTFLHSAAPLVQAGRATAFRRIHLDCLSPVIADTDSRSETPVLWVTKPPLVLLQR
jgi:hypothetical protein